MDLENIFDDELSDSHSVSNMHCILLTECAMTTLSVIHYNKECFLATLVALHLTPVTKSVGAVSN